MPRFFNCGQGCICTSDTCRGCARTAKVCYFFPLKSPTQTSSMLEPVPIVERLESTETATLDVEEVSLVEIGWVLGSIMQDPIAVPADRAFSPMTITLIDTPLSDIVEKLGLITMPQRSE